MIRSPSRQVKGSITGAHGTAPVPTTVGGVDGSTPAARFLLAVLVLAATPSTAAAGVLLADRFDHPLGDGDVIVNSYGAWSGRCTPSEVWHNEGGTWFHDARDGSGWSGTPDRSQPRTCASADRTGSAQLRMWTRREDFGDVRLDVRARVNRLGPGRPWDGLKFYVRRQTRGTAPLDDDRFYVVEPFRRERDAHIQKFHRGRYADVVDTRNGAAPIPFGRWTRITIVARTERGGRAVTVRLRRDGELIARWTDTGQVGGPPIRGAGAFGFRADNTDFNLDDFTISTLDAPAPALVGAPIGPPLDALRELPPGG
jgi:hypothetical protein